MSKIREGLIRAMGQDYVNPWDDFFWWRGETGGPGTCSTGGYVGPNERSILLSKSDEELEALYAQWLVETGG